ncbi:MAG: hypothetical protein PQJ28_01760 [Spirochaetales bacterium]|nr:hypothetical protein [Spirochaetales bacterium]
MYRENHFSVAESKTALESEHPVSGQGPHQEFISKSIDEVA